MVKPGGEWILRNWELEDKNQNTTPWGSNRYLLPPRGKQVLYVSVFSEGTGGTATIAPVNLVLTFQPLDLLENHPCKRLCQKKNATSGVQKLPKLRQIRSVCFSSCSWCSIWRLIRKECCLHFVYPCMVHVATPLFHAYGSIMAVGRCIYAKLYEVFL